MSITLPAPVSGRALRMSLDFLFGRGFLTVEGHKAGGGVTLDRLRMEIPDLRFPFDIEGGAARFRRVRCHVQEVGVTLSESALTRALAPALARVEGFEDIRVHLEPDTLLLQARTTLLSRPAAFSARLALAPARRESPQELLFVPVETLAISELPLPLPLLLQELLRRIVLASDWQALLPDRAPTLRGDVLAVPLLPLIVSEVFLPLGWKLPALERLPAPEVEIRPGALRVSARLPGQGAGEGPALREASGSMQGGRALSLLAARESFREAEQALFGGAFDDALAALRRSRETGVHHDALLNRLADLLLLSGHTSALEEVTGLAQERLSRDPEDLLGLQIRARAAARRGDAGAFGEGLRALREALRGMGRVREQALVLVEGARALQGQDANTSLQLVDEALKLDPRDPQALEVRAEHARERAELEVLEDVLRRMAAVAPQQTQRVRALLELATLAMQRRGDQAEARIFLERALDLEPAEPALHEELARGWEAAGRPVEAVRAWEQAAACWSEDDPARAAQASLSVARIWSGSLDDPQAALGALRRALQWAPDALDALIEALRLCLRSGQLDEGARLLQQAEAIMGRSASGADAAASGEELELLRLSARLEDARGRPELAALTRRRLLRIAPDDRAELRALESWLRQAGVPEDLVAFHEERLESLRADDRDARVETHLALARLHRDVLDQPGAAWQHFSAVLRSDPEHASALEEAEALCNRRGTELEFAALLQEIRPTVAEGDGAAALEFACARAALRGGDRKRALPLLQGLTRRHASALDAHRLLAAHADPEDIPRHLLAVAEQTADHEERFRLRVALGDRAWTLPEGAPEAVRHYRAALAIRHDSEVESRWRRAAAQAGLEATLPHPGRDPSGSDAIPGMEPTQGAHGDASRSEALASAPSVPGPQDAAEPDAPAVVAGGLKGTPAARRPADPAWGMDGAPAFAPTPHSGTTGVRPSDAFGTDSWQSPAGAEGPSPDSGSRRALEAALEQAREAGEQEEEARLLEELAALEEDPVRRAALHSALGRLLYFDLEEPARARPHLEETLRLAPDGEGRSFEVLTAIEGVYEELEDHDALLRIHRRRLEDATDEMRVALRLLMAQLLLDKLERPEDALAIVEDALREKRDHVPCLRLKGEILESVGRFEEAADTLVLLLRQRDLDAFEAQEVQRTLARIEWRELDRLESALQRYETLQSEIPGDPESLSALKQIHGRRGDWSACAGVLLHELALLIGRSGGFADISAVLTLERSEIPKALRSTYARILAELARVIAATEDRSSCISLLELAATLAPSDVSILEAQAELGDTLGAPLVRGRALEALAEMLLAPEDRLRTLSQAATAFADAGEREHALQLERQLDGLRDAFRDVLPPEASASPDPAAEEPPSGPARERMLPASPKEGSELEAAQDGEPGASVETRSSQAPPAATLAPDLVEHLDALAAEGATERALEVIDESLPFAREPGIRRALLLRKGRWIIDTSGASRDASLVLKGALILDEEAADTRFELMRAYIRYTDPRLALEQFREFAARVTPAWLEANESQVMGELKRLSRLPDAPALERLRDELRPGDGASDASKRN